MLDMLGEDARAAVGKVKSLQSQGATPDQIDAQMMEAARNGLLPISVAFAAQKALKRQNPPTPPPQGTVVSDMMQQLQPRQQGIAGLSNPVMDNAQYAGGGIVAFAGGASTSIGSLIEDPLTGDVFEVGADGRHTLLGKAQIDPTSGERYVMTQSGPRTFTPNTPAKPVSRWDRVKSGARKVGEYDVTGGIKNALGKVTARGVARGAGRLIGGGIMAGGIMEGIDAVRGKEVSTEDMREYYGVDPNSGPSNFSTNVAGIFGGGENAAQFIDDLGIRALGTGQRLLTMGLTGPERPEEPAAPAAAKPEEQKLDPTGLNLDYEQTQRGAGGDRYAGIALPSNAAGIQAAYNTARAAVGPTDESKIGDEASYIDAQGKLTEKYQLDKPIKAQQAKIAERRAKLDEDYSKSMLTDLGLAFLTKGVMAAGEGKDTLSALAYSVGEGAKTTKERRDRIEAIREKLDDREAMVESQLATMRENQVTRGLAQREKELGVIRENKTKVATLGLQEAQALLAESGRAQDNQLRVILAKIAATADAEKIDSAERLSREYLYYSSDPKKQAEAQYTLNRIAALNRVSPQFQAAEARIAAERAGLPPAPGAAGGTGKVVNVRPTT